MNNFIDNVRDLMIIFVVIGLPVILLFGRPYFRRWAELKEKQLDNESRLAAEKAAQYATANSALERTHRRLSQTVFPHGERVTVSAGMKRSVSGRGALTSSP